MEMRKTRLHKGWRHAFGGLITKLCHVEGVLEENVDYIASLFLVLLDIMGTKGPDTKLCPIFTIIERHRRDEFIMATMYCL